MSADLFLTSSFCNAYAGLIGSYSQNFRGGSRDEDAHTAIAGETCHRV